MRRSLVSYNGQAFISGVHWFIQEASGLQLASPLAILDTACRLLTPILGRPHAYYERRHRHGSCQTDNTDPAPLRQQQAA